MLSELQMQPQHSGECSVVGSAALPAAATFPDSTRSHRARPHPCLLRTPPPPTPPPPPRASGTPVQNNMRELFGIMNCLDQERWGDVQDFLDTYGDDSPSVEQIQQLQVGWGCQQRMSMVAPCCCM